MTPSFPYLFSEHNFIKTRNLTLGFQNEFSTTFHLINDIRRSEYFLEPLPLPTIGAQYCSQPRKLDNLLPDQPGLQPLSEKDYPDIFYWCEGSWVKHIEEQKEHRKTPSRLRFLTNDDGNPVLESWIKTFMLTTKAWIELYYL
jgi:hypothetical protein